MIRRLGKNDVPAAPILEIVYIFIINCKYVLVGTSTCIDEMLVAFRGRCGFQGW